MSTITQDIKRQIIDQQIVDKMANKRVVLFEDKSFEEKLKHIEKCRVEGLHEIEKGSPSHLADIADMFDIWAPWMLKELRRVPPLEENISEEYLLDYNVTNGHDLFR